MITFICLLAIKQINAAKTCYSEPKLTKNRQIVWKKCQLFYSFIWSKFTWISHLHLYGSIRSSRSHNVHLFVRPILVCLELSIFIFQVAEWGLLKTKERPVKLLSVNNGVNDGIKFHLPSHFHHHSHFQSHSQELDNLIAHIKLLLVAIATLLLSGSVCHNLVKNT